jgi:HD-GYP domain-containing protein (c-di-GMP phosphodiesterase class II)
MSWKLTDYNPEELTEEEIFDQVAQDIYHRGGCSSLCKEFMETIGYKYVASSNRTVFTNEIFVIKFAANEQSIVYNREEESATYRLEDTDIEVIAPVVETQDRGYRWIKMKKADMETTDDHYQQVQSKLSSIGEKADLTDENIGLIGNYAVLVDYPSLSETNLSDALEAHCPELN